MNPSFCRGLFWDPAFWGHEPPVLTECFENTVLVFVPSVYVLVGGLIYSYCRGTWPEKNLPITILYLAKLLTTGAQMFISSYAIYHALTSGTASLSDLDTNLLRLLNFLAVFLLQKRDRDRGISSSAFLAVFWCLELVFELPIYYRHLLTAFGPLNLNFEPIEPSDFIIEMIGYPLILLQFVLAAVTEYYPVLEGGEQSQNTMNMASPTAKLLFSFFTDLARSGYERILSTEDLPPLDDSLASKYCYERWRSVKDSYKARAQKVGLIRSILEAYWHPLVGAWVLESLSVLIRGSAFLLLNELIKNLVSPDQPSWKGYSYVVLILATSNVSSTLTRWVDYILITLGMRIKSLLIAAIVRESLRVDGSNLGKFTSKELLDLLSVDVDRIYQFLNHCGIMIGCPLYVGLCTWLLWIFLGPSCLVGISTVIIMTFLMAIVANVSREVQGNLQMNLKASRLKYISEILSSIKIVKFYGWELPFVDRVQTVRKEENKYLTTFAYLTAILRFLWSVTPFLACFFAFVTYVLVNDLTTIETNVAFVSIALFNGMHFRMVVIPDVISNGVQTLVSVRRIQSFLQAQDLEENVVGKSPGDGYAARWENVSSSWTGRESELTLEDINLSVKAGELIAIVGKEGSGKSSLLKSLFGDLKLLSGRVDLAGSVAYVPQQTWILNGTIKENILFDKNLDREIYRRVLEKCYLMPDLETLPEGEKTDIGSEGVNLSGGQKQRVSLARAVYMDRDVYLLDDPLSAVDAHVASTVFEDVIGNSGILREKTRIVASNMFSVLPRVDRIVFLKDGKIVEQGTYEELRKTVGEFTEFLREHSGSTKKEAEPEPLLIKGPYVRSLGIVTTDSTLMLGEHITHNRTSEEYVPSGSVKLSVYTRYLSKIGIPFCLMILIGFAGARAFDVYTGIWLSEWSSDSPEKTPENYSQRTFRILVYAALGLSYGVLSFIGTACLANGTLSAARKLHNDLLKSIIKAPMSFFDTTPLGKLLNRFDRDVDQLDITLAARLNVFLEMFFQAMAVIVLISINVPIFLVVSSPLFIMYMILQRVFMRTIRQLKRMEAVTRSSVYSHLAETFESPSCIRAHGMQENFISTADVNVDLTQNCSYLVFVGKIWLVTRLDIIVSLLTAISSALLVQQKDVIDPAVAGFVVSYSLGSALAFNHLVHFASEVEAAIGASERIEEYSSIESEPPWKTDYEPEESWPADGSVVFERYSARYRKGLDLVLREIDLQIRPREKIAVVGRFEAGECPLPLSLFRIIEAAEGRLLIDGLDISHLGLHDLRPRLTIIPQDSVIFSGSLRFNLDPNHVHSDEQLWDALEKAHVKRHFEGRGLQTEIAEGGANLSVGQRQLICLARAILQKRRILVINQAATAVDDETDALIQRAIRANFYDCTILTIAHRLNTIMDSDRVIVMESSKVVEEGCPRALLDNPKSRFHKMALEAGLVGTAEKN